MDVPTESEDTSHALTRFHTRVHIADIDQGDARSIEGKFVEAVIILVWPYSTLTQEAGFLVAEKDVLLRKTKGQVKITFYGLCAREIAKLKAGVGDTLRTSLRAAHLIEEQDEISTPGKKPGFAIRYQDAVDVEVSNSGIESKEQDSQHNRFYERMVRPHRSTTKHLKCPVLYEMGRMEYSQRLGTLVSRTYLYTAGLHLPRLHLSRLDLGSHRTHFQGHLLILSPRKMAQYQVVVAKEQNSVDTAVHGVWWMMRKQNKNSRLKFYRHRLCKTWLRVQLLQNPQKASL